MDHRSEDTRTWSTPVKGKMPVVHADGEVVINAGDINSPPSAPLVWHQPCRRADNVHRRRSRRPARFVNSFDDVRSPRPAAALAAAYVVWRDQAHSAGPNCVSVADRLPVRRQTMAWDRCATADSARTRPTQPSASASASVQASATFRRFSTTVDNSQEPARMLPLAPLINLTEPLVGRADE